MLTPDEILNNLGQVFDVLHSSGELIGYPLNKNDVRNIMEEKYDLYTNEKILKKVARKCTERSNRMQGIDGIKGLEELVIVVLNEEFEVIENKDNFIIDNFKDIYDRATTGEELEGLNSMKKKAERILIEENYIWSIYVPLPNLVIEEGIKRYE